MNQLALNRCKAICAAFFLAVLSACGGSGGTPAGSSSATLALVDDAAALVWNSSTAIDVLVNDKTSSGTLSLVSVAQPAHGNVVIAAGKLIYTPTAGYFGADAFTYTARADDSGATATANVALAVDAQVVVKGTATDDALPGAKVTLQVGDREQTVTANANGQYEATLRSSDSTAFVRIDANGAGVQSGVRLRTLVGDFKGLLAAASDGQVTAATVGGLNVSHYSTAAGALATQANGGTEPTSTAQYEAALAHVKPGELLDMATLIKRVVDGGVALPAGSSDVVALVYDHTAYRSFLDATVAADPAAYIAARAEAATSLPSVAPEAPALLTDQTMVYFGTIGPADPAYVITFHSNGNAFVRGPFGAFVGEWVRDDRAIVISFPQPAIFNTYSDDIDPEGGFFNQIAISLTQLVVRRLGSLPRTVSLNQVATFTYLDGSRQGESGTLTDSSAVLKSANLSERLPVTAAEFGEGRRWSGFAKEFVAGTSSSGGFSLLQDAVEIGVSGAMQSLADPSRVYQLTIGDRSLSISMLNGGAGTIPVEYMRLSVNPVTGEERWLALNPVVAGESAYNGVPASIRVAPAEGTVAIDDITRRWQSFRDATGGVVTSLFANGTSSRVTSTAGSPPVVSSMTWHVDSSSFPTPQVEMVLVRPTSTQTRRWLPLTRKDGALWVLETVEVSFGGVESPPSELLSRTLRLEDLGPAEK